MDQNQDQNQSSNQNQNTNQTNKTKGRFQAYLVPVAIAFAGIVIAGAIIGTQVYLSNKTTSGQNGQQQNSQQQLAIDPADTATQNTLNGLSPTYTGDQPYIGSASAPETLIYWSDYQCPYCKQFELTTMQELVTDYVEKGKLKIVFMDFAFLGPDSTTAALAARAIWTLYPDKFYLWRESMFKAQDEENAGFGDETSILALTKLISGIDVNKVSQYIVANQSQISKAIQANYASGTTAVVGGTPAFKIGTGKIFYAVPQDQFDTLINNAL